MKRLLQWIVKLAALAGIAAVVVKAMEQFRGDPDGVGSTSLEAPSSALAGDDSDDPYAVDMTTLGGEVNPELIDRLVCPSDKGPLELVDGAWLVNRRNGNRYPITDGIPVMLVEVGERYRDPGMVVPSSSTDNNE